MFSSICSGNIVRILAVFFMVAGMVVSHARAQVMGENGEEAMARKLQHMYVDYLKKENYSPRIDEDGDVRFTKGSMKYYISVDAKDPRFLHVVLPKIWKADGDEEKAYAILAANRATLELKVAKVFVRGRYISVSVEMFMNRPEDFSGLFERTLKVMEVAAEYLRMTMRSSATPQQNGSASDAECRPEESGKLEI